MYSSVGATDHPDYVSVYIAQLHKAKELFGTPTVAERASYPSTTGYYPSVTVRFVDNVVRYWIDESYRIESSLLDKVLNFIISTSPLLSPLAQKDAARRQFERDRIPLHRWKALLFVTDQKLPINEAQKFWYAVAKFSTWFNGIAESPQPWEFAWGFVKGTVGSLRPPGSPESWAKWLKWGLYAVIAYGGAKLVTSLRTSR